MFFFLVLRKLNWATPHHRSSDIFYLQDRKYFLQCVFELKWNVMQCNRITNQPSETAGTTEPPTAPHDPTPLHHITTCRLQFSFCARPAVICICINMLQVSFIRVSVRILESWHSNMNNCVVLWLLCTYVDSQDWTASPKTQVSERWGCIS